MTQRVIVQIDNMLFVTTDLAKGGAGSGNFGHSGRTGIRGGSGGGGVGGGAVTNQANAIHHENVPLTRKNVSDVLQWSSSRYNETSKKDAVNTSMKILNDENYQLHWKDGTAANEPGAETRPVDPARWPTLKGDPSDRVEVKVTHETFTAGGYTTSSTMGGSEYLVNGIDKTISLGHSEFGSNVEDFVASEVWHFTPKR